MHHGDTARYIAETSLRTFARCVTSGHPSRLLSGRIQRALRTFLRLRSRMRALPPPPAAGFRREYLRFVDPRIRPGIEAIYEQAFAEEPLHRYQEVLDRTSLLAAAMTSAPVAELQEER
jgi:hypothetical protein